MSWGSWLATGFAGTVLLTLLMAGSQGLGLTRMSIPYLLGTMFVDDRDRAHVAGILVHLVNGWIFSLVYVALFHAVGIFTWWAGAIVGLVHGTFVLAVAMPALPGLHPRMASATSGPTVTAPLEPPGFLARNYGVRTPVIVLVAHLVFGAVVGGFYAPAAPGGAPPRAPAAAARVEVRRSLSIVDSGSLAAPWSGPRGRRPPARRPS